MSCYKKISCRKENTVIELPGLCGDLFHAYLIQRIQAIEPILSVLYECLKKTDDFFTDLWYTNFPIRLTNTLMEVSERFGKKFDGKISLDLEIPYGEVGTMCAVTTDTVNKNLRN